MRWKCLTAAAAIAASSGHAAATWSIVLIDTRTGEVGVASATCLTSLDLRQRTPVLITGVGAATAQSFSDTTQQNRTFVRDRLALGVDPQAIITGLATFDGTHQTRQYGIADVLGRTATYTGSQANQWAGGQTGSFEYSWAGKTGTMVYAIQGNILTGSVVVQSAVDAVRDTPGDMPARLMAGMQAARFAGGDGRCSCTSGSPTSCGPTPPSFTKSAHIGYLLIARAGDRDASHGIYRATAALSLTIGDLDGDGRSDLACTNNTGGNSGFGAYLNATPQGGAFPLLALPASYTTGSTPSASAIADFSRDGRPDVITANRGSNNVSLFRGVGGGAFANASAFNAGTAPTAIVAADFDGANGPDFAVAGGGAAGAVTVRRNNGSGSFLAAQTASINAEIRAMVVGQFNGDTNADIAVAVQGVVPRVVVLFGGGDGTFPTSFEIAVPSNANSLVSGDFDGDGDADLAVADQSGAPGITVLLNQGGWFTSSGFAVSPQPLNLLAGDITGDGDPDLVVVRNSSSFQVLVGGPGASFTPGPQTEVGFVLARGALGDLDADGDLDGAFITSNPASFAVVENRNGVFLSGIGAAFGDHFIALNAPNQDETDPDPVEILQQQFDAWRAPLNGRADAVQSLVTAPALFAGGAQRDVTITLRDWQGGPVAGPETITVEAAPGSSPAATIGAPVPLGGGVFRVPLTPGALPGDARLRVTVTGGPRPVVLMPDPVVPVSRCPADFDGDGTAGTDADIAAFFSCLGGLCCPACATADTNADGDAGTDADIEFFFATIGGGGC